MLKFIEFLKIAYIKLISQKVIWLILINKQCFKQNLQESVQYFQHSNLNSRQYYNLLKIYMLLKILILRSLSQL